MSGRFLNVLDDSSWHAQLICDLIRKSAFTLHSGEMPVVCWDELGLKIAGAIDGILTDLLGKDRLLEMKAINHFSFEQLWKMTRWPEDNFTQTALYLRGLQAINPDLTEAVLLMKSKNTSGYIEYTCTYDRHLCDTLAVSRLTRHTGEFVALNEIRPSICQAAVDKFLLVEKHFIAGTLPDRPYEQSDWHCGYCPFNETCWKGYAGELLSMAEDGLLEAEEADNVRFYKELGGQQSDLKKQRDDVRKTIVATMKARGVMQARAGEYLVRLTPQMKTKIDEEGLAPATLNDLAAHRRTYVSETLRVTKRGAPAEPEEEAL